MRERDSASEKETVFTEGLPDVHKHRWQAADNHCLPTNMSGVYLRLSSQVESMTS